MCPGNIIVFFFRGSRRQESLVSGILTVAERPRKLASHEVAGIAPNRSCVLKRRRISTEANVRPERRHSTGIGCWMFLRPWILGLGLYFFARSSRRQEALTFPFNRSKRSKRSAEIQMFIFVPFVFFCKKRSNPEGIESFSPELANPRYLPQNPNVSQSTKQNIPKLTTQPTAPIPKPCKQRLTAKWRPLTAKPTPTLDIQRMHVILAEDIGGWLAIGALFLGSSVASLLALGALYPAYRGMRTLTIRLIAPAIIMAILAVYYFADAYVHREFDVYVELLANFILPWLLMGLAALASCLLSGSLLLWKSRK